MQRAPSSKSDASQRPRSSRRCSRPPSPQSARGGNERSATDDVSRPDRRERPPAAGNNITSLAGTSETGATGVDPEVYTPRNRDPALAEARACEASEGVEQLVLEPLVADGGM